MWLLQEEERCKRLAVDNTELQSQISERDDELGDLVKKYKALVQKVLHLVLLLS